MFCTNCGKMIKDTARFCPYCGQGVKPVPPAQSVQPQAQQTPPVQETPVQQPTQLAQGTPVQQPAQQMQTVQKPLKSGKKKGGIVFLIILLVLLAAGGVGAWFYIQSQDKDTDKPFKEVEGEPVEEAEEEPEEEADETPVPEEETLEEEHPEEPEAVDPLEEARAAYEADDFALALRGCDDALLEDAGREEAYELKADIYLEQEDLEEAALVLCQGIEATDSQMLIDKREDLIAHVVTKSCMQYNSLKDLIGMIQYDDAGNAIRYTYYDGSDVYSTEECAYDGRGLVISRDYYDRNKKLQWSESYDYDVDDNLIYTTHYNAKGREEWQDAYEYDYEGNVIMQTRYNADGSRSWWDEYTYESRESVIKTAHPSSGSTVKLRYEYEYDLFGNQTYCAEYNASDDCNYSWRKEYNGLGDVVKQSSDGEINYVYEYVLQ